MKVVWDRGPLTAGEVVQALEVETDWRPRTIKTLLNRLVQKGAVGMSADGRRFLYRALVTREECVRRETRSFLARVFDGAVAPALVHFLEHEKLTADEIAQLRRTLERGRGGAQGEGKP